MNKLINFQDAFDAENARNMTLRAITKTFIPTNHFEKILCPKNQILLGSRGSGKTVLAKIISHEYLSALDHYKAKQVIESKSIIGIYVSTKAEWVGSLENKPWNNSKEKELFFQWRMNLCTCMALISTIKSCIKTYFEDGKERIKRELLITDGLKSIWSTQDGKEVDTLDQLYEVLRDLEYQGQQTASINYAFGRQFNEGFKSELFFSEIFSPLKRGIEICSKLLEFPEHSSWVLSIDEAEFLEIEHHKILNTCMRADFAGLHFKISTLPYRHYTLDTNSGAPLRDGHDFEYIYIDRDETFLNEDIVDKFFSKRIRLVSDTPIEYKLRDLLGDSELIDDPSVDWIKSETEFLKLKKFSNEKLWSRANSIKNDSQQAFKDQIERKYKGIVKLKERVSNIKGAKKLDIYSGAKLIIKCGDGNPRRLLRIINAIMQSIPKNSDRVALISKVTQNSVLSKVSSDVLEKTKTEPGCGRQLNSFLTSIGRYFHRRLYERQIGANIVAAFSVDASIPKETWTLIERGVEWSLLYPKENKSNNNALPLGEGVFYLANILCPEFKLYPRKGVSVKLDTIMSNEASLWTEEDSEQLEILEEE